MNKLTISNIIAIAVIGLGGVTAWYAMKSKVDQTEIALAIAQRDLESLERETTQQAISLGKIEAGVEFIQRTLDRLEKDEPR